MRTLSYDHGLMTLAYLSPNPQDLFYKGMSHTQINFFDIFMYRMKSVYGLELQSSAPSGDYHFGN